MSSTKLGGFVDLPEGGGAADPWFSHVEVCEPHPPSCDVAVGGVHGAVDLLAVSGGALQPVVSRASRRVALEDLPAGLGWFVGRQSQRARAERFIGVALSRCQFNSTGVSCDWWAGRWVGSWLSGWLFGSCLCCH